VTRNGGQKVVNRLAKLASDISRRRQLSLLHLLSTLQLQEQNELEKAQENSLLSNRQKLPLKLRDLDDH
jgi:hypothetical protein